MIKLLSRTIVVGESHPGMLMRAKKEEYSSTLKEYTAELSASGQYSRGDIRREVEKLGEKLREWYLEPCKSIAGTTKDAECELIRRYRPQIIFLEVMERRSDIKKMANQIGAKLYSFRHFKNEFKYNRNLVLHLESLIDNPKYSKKLAIIGIAHLDLIKYFFGRCDTDFIACSRPDEED